MLEFMQDSQSNVWQHSIREIKMLKSAGLKVEDPKQWWTLKTRASQWMWYKCTRQSWILIGDDFAFNLAKSEAKTGEFSRVSLTVSRRTTKAVGWKELGVVGKLGSICSIVIVLGSISPPWEIWWFSFSKGERWTRSLEGTSILGWLGWSIF